MQDELIKFETAKLAKEKGFHWRELKFTKVPTEKLPIPEVSGDVHPLMGNFMCYNEQAEEINPKYFSNSNPHYSRPTQALLQRWLREKHNLILIVKVSDKDLMNDLIKYQNFLYMPNHWHSALIVHALYETYEEALEAGLIEALKYIPNGNKNTKTTGSI